MKGTAMNKDWFMDYAEHAVRVINIETRRLELRGWITKNGHHILIGEEGGGSSGGAGKGREMYHHEPGTGGGSGGKSAKNVDKSQKCDIIKTDERFDLDPNKINKFLLLPGAKHSEEFFNVGYKPSDYEMLFDDIAAGFDMKKAVDFRPNPSGKEGFSIFMKPIGVMGKTGRRYWIFKLA